MPQMKEISVTLNTAYSLIQPPNYVFGGDFCVLFIWWLIDWLRKQFSGSVILWVALVKIPKSLQCDCFSFWFFHSVDTVSLRWLGNHGEDFGIRVLIFSVSCFLPFPAAQMGLTQAVVSLGPLFPPHLWSRPPEEWRYFCILPQN